MRKAPPTVPGTPIRPSMPPKSFLAQNVTVRPRSAAASTWAKLPSKVTSGSERANCVTTQGSSPSRTRRFEPPPRNLCLTPLESSSCSSPGMPSCLRISSRSVVPPMPREVSDESAVPLRSSTPSSGSAAKILESSMRMVGGALRSEQGNELVAGARDVSSADGQDGVSGTAFFQKEFDRLLHGPYVMNVFVSGTANGFGENFAGDARNGRFAGGINVRDHEDMGQ